MADATSSALTSRTVWGDRSTTFAGTKFLAAWAQDVTDQLVGPAVYNVRGYGATGDGATDDRAAIQNAINACGAAGGGIVYLPEGTYNLTTQTITGAGGIPAHLCISHDNVWLMGGGPGTVLRFTLASVYGIFIDGAAKAARVATGTPQNWYDGYLWHEYGGAGSPQATVYTLSGSYAKGDTTLTLATASQAANFNAGDYIVIRTGQLLASNLGQPDAEVNQVASVNTGAGTIALRWPLAKGYAQEYYITGTNGKTSTSVTANAAPYGVQNVTSRILLNPRISDLTLDMSAVTGSVFGITGGRSWGAAWERVVFRGGAFESFGQHRGHRVTDCEIHHLDTPSGLYALTTDTTSSDAQFTGNRIYGHGTAAIPHFHIHEGSARVLIANNLGIAPAIAVDTQWVSVRARAYDIQVTGNTFTGGGNSVASVYVDDDCTGGGLVADNIFDPLSASVKTALVDSAARSAWMVRDNRSVQGKGMEARGATSVADGGTISHGLADTPARVRLTPSVSGEMASVTAVSSTTFTVALKKHDGTAGTTQTVYWEAEV